MFPVYHRLTLTQFQKHSLRYHIFSNTTGKHCISAINQHKDKRHYIDDLKKHYFLSRWVPLVQPSPTLYCYLTLTQCQNICTVFSQIGLSNILIVGSSSGVSLTSFIQERDTFHQRVSWIHWKHHHYNSIFCMLS